MLEWLFIIFVIAQAAAVSLGIGSSTLAIAGFLTALKDGEMDSSERRIVGVIYVALRVAMVLILLLSIFLIIIQPDFFGSFTAPLFVFLAILYVNAVLMTKHLISMKIGPAIQAGTWYTLGFLMTTYVFSLAEVTLLVAGTFLLVDILIAVLVLNICLKHFVRSS